LASKAWRLTSTHQEPTIGIGDSCDRMEKAKIFLVIGMGLELIKEL
jgi:hypothetical protein